MKFGVSWVFNGVLGRDGNYVLISLLVKQMDFWCVCIYLASKSTVYHSPFVF
jgi:hypothetical protein